MAAALKALSQEGPDKLIFAVPVAPRETLDTLCSSVDDGVCLVVPQNFRAVGQFYQDFGQTTDGEVISLLERQYVGLPANHSRAEHGRAHAREP
jgi:putative phosphoribosyl transferase